MKQLFITFLLAFSFTVYAQPKVLTQATITTKTTVEAPEGDELVQTVTSAEHGEVRMMRSSGDGVTKSTTWLKNNLIKTFSNNEMGETTVIRDNEKKITTTIIEMMGRKSGFYVTDKDQEEMRKSMDSMMKGRGQNMSIGGSIPPSIFDILYINENKIISGFTCKKAYVIGTNSKIKSDTTTVWYCPDFKLKNLPSTGGALGGFGGFNVTASKDGLEDLAGFPMQYEKNMSRGRKMTVQVSKITIDKEIADKEFEVSKDIEIKPMKDMQGGGIRGEGVQIRIAH